MSSLPLLAEAQNIRKNKGQALLRLPLYIHVTFFLLSL